MRIPHTICGFNVQLQIPRQLKFTKHIIFCLWITPTVPNSENFVADSAKLPVSRLIFSNTVF